MLKSKSVLKHITKYIKVSEVQEFDAIKEALEESVNSNSDEGGLVALETLADKDSRWEHYEEILNFFRTSPTGFIENLYGLFGEQVPEVFLWIAKVKYNDENYFVATAGTSFRDVPTEYPTQDQWEAITQQ